MNARYLIALAVLIAILFTGCGITTGGDAQRAPGEQDPLDRYRLYTPAQLAEMEMPREIFFRYYHDSALRQCWHEVRDVAQNSEACRNVIDANHAGCVQRLSAARPETVIRGRDTHQAWVRSYLQCVNPLRYTPGKYSGQ